MRLHGCRLCFKCHISYTHGILYVISGFSPRVNEIFALLVCYTAWIISYWRFGKTYRSRLHGSSCCRLLMLIISPWHCRHTASIHNVKPLYQRPQYFSQSTTIRRVVCTVTHISSKLRMCSCAFEAFPIANLRQGFWSKAYYEKMQILFLFLCHGSASLKSCHFLRIIRFAYRMGNENRI
jgi:hypothetical protein